MDSKKMQLPFMEASKPHHPLHQISASPTHRLLLKQWLEEEDLILSRVRLKELQIDAIRKEITNLFCFFFLFHSISHLLLFNSAPTSHSCRRLWIPSASSLLCSLCIIWVVRYKSDVEAHNEKLLERENEDWKLLGKCVEELKCWLSFNFYGGSVLLICRTHSVLPLLLKCSNI